MSLPSTYKQAVFKAKGEPLTLEDTTLKQPGRGEILVKVEACGVCHSDVFAQYDIFYQGFPRVPGHEIIGKVAAVGEGVEDWKAGDRIGAGWHGGHDGSCYGCQNGWTASCDNGVINGITKDGGCKSLLYCFFFSDGQWTASIQSQPSADADGFFSLQMPSTPPSMQSLRFASLRTWMLPSSLQSSAQA